MPTPRARRAITASMLAVLVLPGVVAGCSSPTAPPPAPGGGQVLVLDFTTFAETVEPALQRRGCDTGNDCHGGGIRGTLALSPRDAKNVQYDFEQVSLQVSTLSPDSSRILLKPLAVEAGGSPHASKPFASRADTDYVAIRAWIASGVLR